jgi:hypothetical protein
MELDHLMVRFARLPGAQVGYGPHHPEAPDHSLEPEVDAFLRQYPTLCADLGYVDFLRRYGGAGIEDEDQHLVVDILGFTDVSSSIYDMDGPIVDDQGFIVFAQIIRHIVEDGKLCDTQEYDYAFDATGERQFGVYWAYSASKQPETLTVGSEGFRPSGEDFLGWLARVIEVKGVLAPPRHGPGVVQP